MPRATASTPRTARALAILPAAPLPRAAGRARAAVAAFICATCGVQSAPSDAPPPDCPICLDERQYVGWGGQRWTTLDELRLAGHRNRVQEDESGLTAIWT